MIFNDVKDAFTYEVAPCRIVCTYAAVDEFDQPIKQPVRGKTQMIEYKYI